MRSTITVCPIEPASITPWITSRDCDGGMGSVGWSQPATQTHNTNNAWCALSSPRNGHPERWEHRKLSQPDALRWDRGVVEQVREDVPRVVHVHDADERRDRGASDVSVAREAHVQSLRERETF